MTGSHKRMGLTMQKEACPNPHKVCYVDRSAAARVRRKRGWKAVRPYHCVCGAWHLGNLAANVLKGKVSRKEAHG